jgi:maltose O-acetyltransferase
MPITRRIVAALYHELHFDPAKVMANLLTVVMPRFAFGRTRSVLLRAAGVQVGTHTLIMGPVHLTGEADASKLTIGDHVMISGPLYVDLGASVEVGDRVHLGHDVMLLTQTHKIGGPNERCGERESAPIRIEAGAWLASRVTVLPGVTIGKGSVVAAGAVVAENVPANVLVGGVPAKRIRSLVSVGSRTTAHAPPQSIGDYAGNPTG